MESMSRFIHIESEFLLEPVEVVVELNALEVAALALEMTLLLNALTDSVRMIGGKGSSKVVLTLGKEQKTVKASIRLEKQNVVHVSVGKNQAEYLQSFLLRAHRDDQAEVDHLHIEGLTEDKPFDLTLMFVQHRAPMSAAEAAKLMGD